MITTKISPAPVCHHTAGARNFGWLIKIIKCWLAREHQFHPTAHGGPLWSMVRKLRGDRLPVERLTRNTDINFDRQQRQTSWLIVALSTLLAALATFPLARGLLAPVKRLVDGTHKLAAGDFTTRVAPTSEDELGRLAEDFNQLASTLEKNQQMRRDFMADISHELRTPLAVLRGELEAIQDGVRKFTPETLASLQAEVGTLTKLVDDLHQLSMSDEGALAYQKAPVDLIPLLEVAGGAFRERFASRGLKLQFSLPDSITVFGDRDRLMQLFNNLLENSLRYTDSGGSLKSLPNSTTKRCA